MLRVSAWIGGILLLGGMGSLVGSSFAMMQTFTGIGVADDIATASAGITGGVASALFFIKIGLLLMAIGSLIMIPSLVNFSRAQQAERAAQDDPAVPFKS